MGACTGLFRRQKFLAYESGLMSAPRTPRGRATKERIVGVAAALMYKRGVSAVSLDDVLLASGAGKGQFYHYFSNRQELVAEVMRHQLDQVLREQKLFELDTWEGIHAWLEALVGMQQNQRGFRGCPLGVIASVVVEHGDVLRRSAADAFALWESSVSAGLRLLQANGLLRTDADPDALAETAIALLQGGYLLSSVKRNVRPMRSAVDAAEKHLESFRTIHDPGCSRGLDPPVSNRDLAM